MDKSDELLNVLDDEIEKKCFEIKQKKSEKRLQRFFVTACVLFVILPFLFTFAGVNLLTLFIPAVIFLAVSFILLIPILINNNLGGITE